MIGGLIMVQRAAASRPPCFDSAYQHRHLHEQSNERVARGRAPASFSRLCHTDL